MLYKGSCHCGKVAFEVEGEIGKVMDCNCSMCARKGSLLWFVPRHKLRLLTPEENSKAYLFGDKTIQHRFCPECGIHPYGEGNIAECRENLLEIFADYLNLQVTDDLYRAAAY